MITNATFAPLDEDEFTTWETNSGDVSITYNEHCIVLVGMIRNLYIFEIHLRIA